MTRIEFDDGAFQVDAAVLAEGLKLEPGQVQSLMRGGAITSLCERGVEADAGRHRLTFFHKGRVLRLVVDEAGQLIRRSVIDFGNQPLPAALQRPGG